MHKIMIVDDEAVITTQLEERLTSMGYEVAGMASSGEESIEMAQRLKPDLILMDIVMRGKIDGIAAAQIIKEKQDIPVIFLTGYTENHFIGRAKHVEPYGYIVKPFQEREIKASIEVALHKKQMEEALHKAHEELERRVEERTAELVGANKQLKAEIEERKQSQESLRESEEKYKTLTESSLTGIYIHQDGRYVFVNDRFAQIHGYKPEELLGEHYLTLIHPDETERIKQIRSKRLKGEPAPDRYEVKRLRKDGEAVWCETIPVRIEYRGKPAIIGNIVDINEHKLAEEALRESEERFRTFAEAAPYGLSIMRPDKTFEYLNPRFTEIFGYTSEDIPDKYIWFEKAYPDKEYRDTVISVWKQYFAEDFDGGQIEPNIFKVRCKDGQNKIIHFRNVISDDGRHFLTYQDITAQAKAEEALRERETQLEIKTNSLKEMNTALRVLLERRDEDKRGLEEKVLVNVKELVVPFLEKVKRSRLDPEQMAHIRVLESNLNDIVSPFLRTLSSKYSNLTPTEIRVAHLIKEGKTTKEIGEVMALSPRTIETHRKNMRKKLGIEKNKGNLRSHLLSLQ